VDHRSHPALAGGAVTCIHRPRISLPGMPAYCGAERRRHEIPGTMHPLPHGIHRCRAPIDSARGVERCGAVSWVWAHRDGICLVVPITEQEARTIEQARMSDSAVLGFLGLSFAAA